MAESLFPPAPVMDAAVHEKHFGHHEEGATAATDDEVAHWAGALEDARQATAAEHSVTLFQALKIYPKAVGWSVLVSMAVIMEGYDTSMIGSFFAYPAFQKKYGTYSAIGGYQIPAKWQVGLTNSGTVGTVLGVFANGFLTERYGHKRVLLCSYVLMTLFIFIPFFSPSVEVLVVGEILCGLPWGVFSTLAPAYASEVCPVVLRGFLTTYVNLCWTIGGFIASGVLDGLESRTDQWAYRIPFALQWVWPAVLFPIMCFAPESPWWLVRQGRLEDAEKSLKRLSRKSSKIDPKQTLAMMAHTDRYEKEVSTGGSYLDCFKGVDLRRTEICVMAWAIQVLCGLLFGGSYSQYFFEQAGLSAANVYKLGVGQNGLAVLGTLTSWILLANFGRRPIYICGLCWITAIMFIVGFLSLDNNPDKNIDWVQSVLLIVWLFSFDLTVGPVTYAVVSETSSMKLRSKTISISRMFYNVLAIVGGVFTPYMLNPTEGDWKGKTAFFWGVSSLGCCVWA